ncbi:MAG: helix-turn-helix domain-containing protein [Clostridia bacterium]|nr:helix-turn-helix domain-containing protein [Clostridia bacterium]
MDRDLFRITLQGAIAGNHDDFLKIIDLYAPLIDNHCFINGKLDPDLRQYILMHIALKISKFII